VISAVKIEQLHKRFGELHALRGVSLDIAQGEFFALLGPNGAGKTTLISILAGLTRADGGSVEVMGHNVVTDYRAARRLLGVVPQELAYDPFFTVRENLRIQSGYFGLRQNDDWIDEIITNLGLTDKANTNMRALSGGMKRRVLVAQALVHKPPVIILDEPTAGVDVSLRASLWEFVSDLNKSGHTIILTTHYLEEAEALCNRVAILNQGEVVALDTTAALLKSSGELKLKIQIKPNQLPLGLSSYVVKQSNDSYSFLIHKPAEVEGILAQLRIAGISLVDMVLTKPDLEDVFLQMTSSI
jgi:ABC-2 type transport system ATP-binding protein